jgi:hypothetical protein
MQNVVIHDLTINNYAAPASGSVALPIHLRHVSLPCVFSISTQVANEPRLRLSTRWLTLTLYSACMSVVTRAPRAVKNFALTVTRHIGS